MTQVTPELIVDLLQVGGFKTELMVSILARADFRCEYCGQDLLASLTECFNAQADHIIPRSKGGPNAESNFAACCTTCNSLKWTYVPISESRDERISVSRIVQIL